jgi:predicted GIY-YIG superfamily endonuclease/proteasome lid subunit RPN8/RPN11
MTFWTYMLHCRGGVFYIGHTDDLDRRVGDHKSGLVQGFTSDLLPVELVWAQDFLTRIEALEAERRIKGWSRAKKLALIRGDWEEISCLAKAKSGPSASSGRTGSGVKGTEIALARTVLKQLGIEAANASPHEACGILLGRDTQIEAIRPAANIHPVPATRFEIDPQALVDAFRAARVGGRQIIGYYHSHPNGDAVPSTTDRAMASGDGKVWAIIARGEVRFWRDGALGFEPLSYCLLDG